MGGTGGYAAAFLPMCPGINGDLCGGVGHRGSAWSVERSNRGGKGASKDCPAQRFGEIPFTIDNRQPVTNRRADDLLEKSQVSPQKEKFPSTTQTRPAPVGFCLPVQTFRHITACSGTSGALAGEYCECLSGLRVNGGGRMVNPVATQCSTFSTQGQVLLRVSQRANREYPRWSSGPLMCRRGCRGGGCTGIDGT